MAADSERERDREGERDLRSELINIFWKCDRQGEKYFPLGGFLNILVGIGPAQKSNWIQWLIESDAAFVKYEVFFDWLFSEEGSKQRMLTTLDKRVVDVQEGGQRSVAVQTEVNIPEVAAQPLAAASPAVPALEQLDSTAAPHKEAMAQTTVVNSAGKAASPIATATPLTADPATSMTAAEPVAGAKVVSPIANVTPATAAPATCVTAAEPVAVAKAVSPIAKVTAMTGAQAISGTAAEPVAGDKAVSPIANVNPVTAAPATCVTAAEPVSGAQAMSPIANMTPLTAAPATSGIAAEPMAVAKAVSPSANVTPATAAPATSVSSAEPVAGAQAMSPIANVTTVTAAPASSVTAAEPVAGAAPAISTTAAVSVAGASAVPSSAQAFSVIAAEYMAVSKAESSIDEETREVNYDKMLQCKMDDVASRKLSAWLAYERIGNKDPWTQDAIYLGTGLAALLQDAEAVKPHFDKLCMQFAKALSMLANAPCCHIHAPVKNRSRAEEKVLIKSLGNSTMLTDALRATLVLDATRADLMEIVYEFLHMLILRKPREANRAQDSPVAKTTTTSQDALAVIKEAMKTAGARVKHFDDRYLKPKGEYRDWLLLIEMHGLTAELQLNFDVAMWRKEGILHLKYEDKRKLQDRLLQSGIQGDELGIAGAIWYGANAKETLRDCMGFTPLHYASAYGNIPATQILLAHNADPFITDMEGLLPLHRAVVRGHEPIVTMLVPAMEARQAQLSTMADSSKQGLFKVWRIACTRASTIADTLYQLFALTVPSWDDQIHYAARAGDSAACRDIQSNGGDINSWRFRPDVGSMVYALDEAVLVGSVAASVVCLQLGGAFHKDGPHSDLQRAAEQYAERDMASQLAALLAVGEHMNTDGALEGNLLVRIDKTSGMRLGIDVDHLNGETLLIERVDDGLVRKWNFENPDKEVRVGDHIIEVNQVRGDAMKIIGEVRTNQVLHITIRSSFAKHHSGRLDRNRLLDLAAQHLAWKALQVLVEERGPMNPLGDSSGQACTAFRKAAARGAEQEVALLLSARIAVDAADEMGRTALWLAATAGEEGICHVLLKADADKDKRDSNGRTAAWMAVQSRRLGVLELLQKWEADFSLPDQFGVTPAYVAAQKGHLQELEFLHSAGQDLGLGNGSGETPAYAAAEKGQIQTLAYLRDADHDLNKVTNDNVTPAYIAALHGHLSVLKLLRDSNVNLSQAINQGWTPARIARHKGHKEIDEFFSSKEIEDAVDSDAVVNAIVVNAKSPQVGMASSRANETSKSVVREERPEHQFENGAIYTGEWLRHIRDGYGVQVWNDGAKYEGQWVNDKAQGKGKFVHVDGDIYEGEWSNDKAHGRGTYHYSDGSKYEGQWEEDKQNGEGTEEWPDGVKYVGQYSRGYKHGNGKFSWADGSWYEGEFMENDIHGNGVYMWAPAPAAIRTPLAPPAPLGFIRSPVAVASGTAHSLQYGISSGLSPGSRRFDGQWAKNRMQGKGVFVWSDGRRYEGEFNNDQKDGHGVFKWPDGRSWDGQWRNGKQHGRGTYTTARGEKREGEWEDGRRTRWLNEVWNAVHNS